jgi:DNA-binding MarR family transcriptional regulator
MSEVTHRVAERLHSVSIRLLRKVRKADLEAPVGPAQLSALSVLYFSDALPLGRLAETEQVSAPTMSRIVASLERLEAIARHPDPEDARSQLIGITTVGRTIFDAARERRIEAVAAVLKALSPMTVGVLDLVLPELAQAIERTPSEA